MNTFLKSLAVLFILVALAAGGGAAYLYARYPAVPPAEALTIHATPAMLARGQYLFEHVSLCVDCHSTRDWSKYGAPVMPGTIGKGGDLYGRNIGLPGDFYARNITPAGLGGWSDGEIVRAMTTGVSRDGEPLFPIMPYPRYGRMAQPSCCRRRRARPWRASRPPARPPCRVYRSSFEPPAPPRATLHAS